MDAAQALIIQWATRLAAELPSGQLHALADVVEQRAGEGWSVLQHQAGAVIPQAQGHGLVVAFLKVWREQSQQVPPLAVAIALRAAAVATARTRGEQTVELVRTGPPAAGSAMRRTDQALLQVINAAQRSLLVVSFAVYKIPEIAQALVRAAQRGVDLRICVEAPEPSGQHMAYDTLQALGPDVASYAQIYIWPLDQRPAGPSGKPAALHTKCAVADERLLFISSANLTEYALEINMELGVLIQGQALAHTVTAYYQALIDTGVLQKP